MNKRATMRCTEDHKRHTRRRIVEAASRLFRERGFDGIGVAALMKAVGLTHGGFYAHFPSKEALAAECCMHALAETTAGRRAAIGGAAGPTALARLRSRYLAPQHRDGVATGCAIAALGPEIARQGPEVRRAFGEGVEALIEVIAAHAPGAKPAQRRQAAIGALATMVGGLILARAVEGEAESDAILDAARQFVLPGADMAVAGAPIAGAPIEGAAIVGAMGAGEAG